MMKFDWSDLSPRPYPPAADHVTAIQLDEASAELMGYFWAGVERHEVSDRMYNLSGEIIVSLNAAHYTVWHWRWKCLLALTENLKGAELQGFFDKELALVHAVAIENPKNYQLWNHRRKLALFRGATCARDELDFTAACIAHDAKNYHAWAHRQAILKHYDVHDLWLEEITFVEQMIEDDIYNNSAWSQRVLVMEHTRKNDPCVYDSEFAYVADKLKVSPRNESAWNYLRGLAGKYSCLATDKRVEEMSISILSAQPNCVPAVSLLADIYSDRACVLLHVADKYEASRKCARIASQIFDTLKIADPMRIRFYTFRKGQLSDYSL